MLTKLYIAVREEVPSYMVPVLVAHTILNADRYFKYECASFEVNYRYLAWLEESFKKCVVKVNKKEWHKILNIPYVFLGHENTVLNAEKSCAIIPIMDEYPNVIKFARLWSP